MSEKLDLTSFIPKDKKGEEIELSEDLTPVVDRISRILPPDKIWEFYASSLNEGGGKIKFPYCRIDSNVVATRDWIGLIKRPKYSPENPAEYYKIASLAALKVLLWVEVGFEGLENLAKNPASRNWTGLGYYVNDEERARQIVTNGAELYKECLGKFVQFRLEQQIISDCFTEYGVEYLLDSFRPQSDKPLAL